MRVVASIISVIFHPIFILYYIFGILHIIKPVSFLYSESRQGLAVHFLVFGMSVFFPLVSTLSIRAAGLIKSIRLDDPKERIGPMIATIIFFVWLFLNYRQLKIGPVEYSATILGATIALSASFLINNFSKISLHCVGMGGLVGALGVYRFTIPKTSYDISIGEWFLSLSPNLLFSLAIIFAGLVGSSRLYLGKHRSQDVFGGYLVGFISQIVAYYFLGPF